MSRISKSLFDIINNKIEKAMLSNDKNKVVFKIKKGENKYIVLESPASDIDALFNCYDINIKVTKDLIKNTEPMCARTARRHFKALVEGKKISELK